MRFMAAQVRTLTEYWKLRNADVTWVLQSWFSELLSSGNFAECADAEFSSYAGRAGAPYRGGHPAGGAAPGAGDRTDGGGGGRVGADGPGCAERRDSVLYGMHAGLL